MTVILVTSSAVLLLTCMVFFVYEFHSFRQSAISQFTTLGKIIAANSTAALAFEDSQDAAEVLATLRAEPHVVTAVIYDLEGKIFSQYPARIFIDPDIKDQLNLGYHFSTTYMDGCQPIFQGSKKLGTLYLKSDLGAMYEKFRLYGIVALLATALSSLLAYQISKVLQKNISNPILVLAETAKAVSLKGDYSVRVASPGKDELGALTDAFNQMLLQIQEQNKALNEFNQTLEQKVMNRTLELEASNKELESFSYSVSHDLRAPLRSIHGYTNILSENYSSQFDEEANRVMKVILNNTEKMGQLIDDLLAFSKLSRTDLTKSKISMSSLVHEVWDELLKMESGRTNIQFKMTMLHDACADRTTIKQVWINLLSNALKYSRKKEMASIDVSSEEKDDSIIYTVRDNGSGFDMKYYDKLFGVFQRLHSQKEFEGTGVGLAIVQRITIKHGGKIWANSEADKGASFYFSIPKNNDSLA